MMRFTVVAACVVMGCGYTYPGDVPLDADTRIDADVLVDANADANADGASVDATPRTWSTPVPLALNTPNGREGGPRVSPNGLGLYFEAPQTPGDFVTDIFYVTRTATSFDWGDSRAAVGALNTTESESGADVSADELEVHFNRAGAISVSKRPTPGAGWGPTMATGLTGGEPNILADGLTMYYRATGATCPVELCRMRVTRATSASPWGNPVLESINDGGTYQSAFISRDGLRALLSAPMTAAVAPVAIVSRATRIAPWGAASPIPELALYTAIIRATWSWDEQEMYLTFSTGAQDIYISHLR